MKVKTFVKTALNTINTFVVNDIQGNFICTVFKGDCERDKYSYPILNKTVHTFTVQDDENGFLYYVIFVKAQES